PAEDSIRDRNVTGVQTCALPISRDGTLNINNRIVDASDKVTNRRLQHATIETIIKVETAKPRTVQHHTKTITSARLLNLSKRSRSEERREGKQPRTPSAKEHDTI